MASYNNIYSMSSPYFTTDVFENQFLDVMVNRPIPMLSSDVYYTLKPAYEYRPDLLAYDLYNNARLWWVFAQRNPNILVDPLFDFKAGLQIYLPTLPVLQRVLGI